MFIALVLSLLVPGIVLLSVPKKYEGYWTAARLGWLAGFLPIFAALLWGAYFAIFYRKGYSFDQMQTMNGFTLMFYALVPFLVPIFANIVWRNTGKGLARERFFLFLGYLGGVILCFQTPDRWDFSFVLLPFSLLVLGIGFMFLRRKKPFRQDSEGESQGPLENHL